MHTYKHTKQWVKIIKIVDQRSMNENKLFGVPSSFVSGSETEEKKNEVEQALKLKEKKLADARLHVDTLADAEGKGIDVGIKDTIAVLNVWDIPTTQSCEGHTQQREGRPYPWVRVGVDGEPEERFVGEDALFREVALKHGVSVEELKRGEPIELYGEVRRVISENDETEEFKRWTEKNEAMQRRMQGLLDDFYAERKVGDDIRLILQESAGGEFEVKSNELRENDIIFREISSEDFADIVKKLELRQKEMREFTDFVRVKFLEN